MSRRKDPDAQKVYGAAELFVDRCLRADDSLFTPGTPLWTSEHLRDLHQRFVGQPDLSGDSFENKFKRQLASAPTATYQLAAELRYVYEIVIWPGAVTANTKRQRVQAILSWSPQPPQIPSEIDHALDGGIAHPGQYYLTKPHVQLWFLLEFSIALKHKDDSEQSRLLSDPWAFRDFVYSLELNSAYTMREALLHLVFPDTFDGIVSDTHKKTIGRRLSQYVRDPAANVDRQIGDIRAALTGRYGNDFDWYTNKDVRALWHDDSVAKPPAVAEGSASFQAASSDDAGAQARMLGRILEERKQGIIYGPPGTGKTFTALRFAVAWLAKTWQPGNAPGVLSDPAAFERVQKALSTVQAETRVWWIVASHKVWDWAELAHQRTVDFRIGRLERNYPLVQPGDLVVGYQATPAKRVVVLGQTVQGLHPVGSEGEKITIEHVADIAGGPSYEELSDDPVMRNSEPMRFRCQGTLFALSADEAEYMFALITERDPRLAESVARPRRAIGPLTRLTFHPTYSYEDFVEGYRPTQDGVGLQLRLSDGVFKRICRAAAQDSTGRPYLVMIDEINRANLAKVFGELITLLEADKRGLTVVLPQSRETFAIPPNVYLLGTMNTADRSIRLLDAALRRRFGFLELMPAPELLGNTQIGPLSLSVFLTELNRRVSAHEGREKQIGHSFLMKDGEPVTTPEDFAARFRFEILPLLQEYAYQDYSELRRYLGPALIEGDRVLPAIDDPQALLEALAEEYATAEK